MSLLTVENLNVNFSIKDKTVNAINGMSYSVDKGEILAIVGESGSGKSVSSRAIMGLIDDNGIYTADKILFEGKPITKKNLGKEISMIFQDPINSLNPCFTVGQQIIETLKIHKIGSSKKERKQITIDLLQSVGIPNPEVRINSYPHQLSGGMCQRVVISMSLACNPKIIFADEPTTALDVTMQAQIMKLLVEKQKEYNMALILITHDLALVAEHADRVIVMYSGEVVETGTCDEVIHDPKHPYTKALLSTLPENATDGKLNTIEGSIPSLFEKPEGCLLSPRCLHCFDKCKKSRPKLVATSDTHSVSCFLI